MPARSPPGRSAERGCRRGLQPGESGSSQPRFRASRRSKELHRGATRCCNPPALPIERPNAPRLLLPGAALPFPGSGRREHRSGRPALCAPQVKGKRRRESKTPSRPQVSAPRQRSRRAARLRAPPDKAPRPLPAPPRRPEPTCGRGASQGGPARNFSRFQPFPRRPPAPQPLTRPRRPPARSPRRQWGRHSPARRRSAPPAPRARAWAA